MKVRLALLVLISIALSGCQVMTPEVERLQYVNGEFPNWKGDGIVYALPKKQFTVTLDVSRTVLEKPKCTIDETSAAILDVEVSKVSLSGQTLFSISGATLTSQAVPDMDKVLVSRMPESKAFADSSLLVNMGARGLIEGFEGSATSKSVQVAAKLLELGGALGSSAVLFGASSPSAITSNDCAEKLNEYSRLRDLSKGFKESPIPHFKKTIDLYNEEIKAEQAVIKALFIGKPSVLTGTIACHVSPSSVGKIGVIEFSVLKGFRSKNGIQCEGDDRFFTGGRLTDVRTIILSIMLTNNTLVTATGKSQEKLKDVAGFFYNVPAQAMVWLEGHQKALTAPEEHSIPQLGLMRSIPRVKGYSPVLIVNLHPETGALKSVRATHTAADYPGLIGSINSSSGALLTALKTKKEIEETAAKEAAAGETELAKLTAKKDLLETLLAIQTVEEALKQ